MSHEYTVEFRISDPALDLNKITALLEVRPTYTCIAGAKRGPLTYTSTVWAFNGYDPDTKDVSWHDLEIGLNFILDRLWPKRRILRQIRQYSSQFWWCGHFQDAFSGGPSLTPDLMLRLGKFGVPLRLDNYFSEDEP